jgi:hypothetical protein
MVSKSDVVFIVDGAVERELKLSFSDLARFPRQNLRATDELGKESLFEGVLVAEILKAAGVKFGKELRGKRLADYLLVETADGYRVVSLYRSLIQALSRALCSSRIAATAVHSPKATDSFG